MKRALTACLALAACGSPPPAPPPDEALALALTAGNLAMSLSRTDEAERHYRDAARLALAGDDAAAIGIAGANLAIALTAEAKPDAALASIAATKADLDRRRAVPPPELALAEAAALLRLGRPAQAATAAAPAENAPDPAVAARAAFLRGLAADALGDRALLGRSLARLEAAKTLSPTGQADRAELLARQARAAGNPGAALAAALDAIDLRRAAGDDRGLRRDLRLAATVADPPLAADLRMRAEQSEKAGAPPLDPAKGEPLESVR